MPSTDTTANFIEAGPTSASMDAPVSETHRRCFLAFEGLIEALREPVRDFNDQLPPAAVLEEFDKYKIWAGNVGAAHAGELYNISLDYRLKDASFLRSQVVSLMMTLEKNITNATLLVRGERQPFEECLDHHPGSSSPQSDDSLAEDSPWEISSESSAASESSRGLNHHESSPATKPRSEEVSKGFAATFGHLPTLEMPRLLESIKFIVTCLYRVPIRKPAPLDRLKQKATLDLSHYQHFDVLYIRDKFPKLDPDLATRLGKMITTRRQVLRYREIHRKKIDGDYVQPQKLLAASVPQFLATAGLSTVDVKDGPGQAVRARLASSQAASSHFSLTSKATTVQPVNMIGTLQDGEDPTALFAPSVAESKSSVASSYATKDLPVEVPPRPKDADWKAQERFECPYCLVAQIVSTDRKWEKHVFKDLQPYVCTYDDCDLYDHFFHTKDEWFRHESQFHRAAWFCNTAGHTGHSDGSEFLEHMKSEHCFDTAQFGLLKDMFRQPSRSISGTCNLCKRDSTRLKSHVSKHLKQMALFALPRANENGESAYPGRRTESAPYENPRHDSDDSEDSQPSRKTKNEDREQHMKEDYESDDLAGVIDDYDLMEVSDVPETMDQQWDDITEKFSKARTRSYRPLNILLISPDPMLWRYIGEFFEKAHCKVLASPEGHLGDIAVIAPITGSLEGSEILGGMLITQPNLPLIVLDPSDTWSLWSTRAGQIPQVDVLIKDAPFLSQLQEALSRLCLWEPSIPTGESKDLMHMDSSYQTMVSSSDRMSTDKSELPDIDWWKNQAGPSAVASENIARLLDEFLNDPHNSKISFAFDSLDSLRRRIIMSGGPRAWTWRDFIMELEARLGFHEILTREYMLAMQPRLTALRRNFPGTPAFHRGDKDPLHEGGPSPFKSPRLLSHTGEWCYGVRSGEDGSIEWVPETLFDRSCFSYDSQKYSSFPPFIDARNFHRPNEGLPRRVVLSEDFVKLPDDNFDGKACFLQLFRSQADILATLLKSQVEVWADCTHCYGTGHYVCSSCGGCGCIACSDRTLGGYFTCGYPHSSPGKATTIVQERFKGLGCWISKLIRHLKHVEYPYLKWKTFSSVVESQICRNPRDEPRPYPRGADTELDEFRAMFDELLKVKRASNSDKPNFEIGDTVDLRNLVTPPNFSDISPARIESRNYTLIEHGTYGWAYKLIWTAVGRPQTCWFEEDVLKLVSASEARDKDKLWRGEETAIYKSIKFAPYFCRKVVTCPATFFSIEDRQDHEEQEGPCTGEVLPSTKIMWLLYGKTFCSYAKCTEILDSDEEYETHKARCAYRDEQES